MFQAPRCASATAILVTGASRFGFLNTLSLSPRLVLPSERSGGQSARPALRTGRRARHIHTICMPKIGLPQLGPSAPDLNNIFANPFNRLDTCRSAT